MSPTVHLVYPHGHGIRAPDVIGRQLGAYLSQRHDVVLHDWDSMRLLSPSGGDVLIGHPHPMPGTIFRRSFGRHGWSRRLVLSPFNGDPRQVGFLDPFVRRADAYLAITGAWWIRTLPETPMWHWAPRIVHLDLAIDPDDFPFVKPKFAPPGRRRFLFIGHSGWQKNVGYLSEIARTCTTTDFGWIGRGRSTDIPGVAHHGFRDTSERSSLDLVSTYDFLITVGRWDANPMTVLEAMSWGLIPVCTPQSGYVSEAGVFNIPLDDVAGVARVVQRLQQEPDAALMHAQRANANRLRDHFTWERFGAVVEGAIDARLPPAHPTPATARLRLASAAMTSPLGPFHRDGQRLAARTVRRELARRRRGNG